MKSRDWKKHHPFSSPEVAAAGKTKWVIREKSGSRVWKRGDTV
jgi:hypothetical protein